MKNIIIRIIISIVVILVISACSVDEESTTTTTITTTTPTYTCTGSSSGSGPTIGGVTLKEATYTQDNNSITFVNSTSANNVHSSSINYCVTINVSSTTASMLIINSANTGNATMSGVSLAGYDNVTAYYTVMANSDLNANYHMYIFADNDSSFYLNGWGFDAKSKADAAYVLSKLYTEQ
tara:strand:- start:32 stop:571 length:540 start_codon:yes stop_codon:yes gene_type:complete